MNQNKMYLVNKIFNNQDIRTIWDNEKEKYFISVIDIVAVVSESDRPRKYWSDLKSKLKAEGSELSEIIGQLKLKASDGKYYKTDVTDIEGMFRIIESIPSKNAEPIKQWLAHLGSERVDEVFDPSIEMIQDLEIELNMDDVKELLGYLNEVYNNTRVWSNNGWTPIELRNNIVILC